VVFNDEISQSTQGTAVQNYPDLKAMTQLTGEWQVRFDTAWGGSSSISFPELLDWSQHADERIKYYSGTAVYYKTFNLEDEPKKDKKYFLELGSVKDVGIAEVKINGKDKGIVWTAPFRVDISNELKRGSNRLQISVVNSWYNRVAGDQIFPERKQFTQTNIMLKHDFRGRPIEKIVLEPSGLLGPVKVLEGSVY
jgi:hypothetical protein